MQWDDRRWAIAVTLATIAGPFLIVWIFVAQRTSKAISVETVSRATVADLTDPALAALKLTFNEEPVNRVTAATIEVINSGTEPIERADFERPLTLRFGGSAPLLAATVGERAPQNLAPLLDYDLNAVRIEPMLLNPGDRFRLTLHLRGQFNEPEVDARISGIKEVSRMTLPEERGDQMPMAFWFLVVVPTLFCYFYLAALSNWLRRRQRKEPVLLPVRVGIALALVLGLSASTALVMAAFSWRNLPFWVLPRLPFPWSFLFWVGLLVVGIGGALLGFRTRELMQTRWDIVEKSAALAP
jgi:hypothetical protein